MSKLTAFFTTRTDDELLAAGKELDNFIKSGSLNDTFLLRSWYEKFFEPMTPVFVIENVVEHEIARRWLKEKEELKQKRDLA